MRCLIIDDDDDSRGLVTRMVRQLGHKVTAVESGTAAMSSLGNDRYDVALVDLEMPGMNGAETLRALREADKRMRLLVVSGRDDRHHVIEALHAGADGYLVKDELGTRLGPALQDVLAGKSPLSGGPASILVRAISGRLPPLTPRTTPPGGTAALSPRPTTAPGERQGDRSGELIIGAVKLEKREDPYAEVTIDDFVDQPKSKA